MAKIVYYPSPIDTSKVKEFESSKSIGQILFDLNISKLALQVSINGETPDNIDLDYIPQDTDTIEIRRPVFGSSSRSKSNLALVVQLIGLAAMFIPGIGTAVSIAILTATGIAAGALNARASKLALSEGEQSEPTIDTDTNNFSLATISNEARPLKPMPLVMGSHRFAPDYHTNSYLSVYDQSFTTGWQNPFVSSFIPGVYSDNGPLSTDYDNWIEMPANYISAGFPEYKVLIAPYHFPIPDFPTPAQKTAVLEELKNYYLSTPDPSILYYSFFRSRSAPIICYHHDPSDITYGRYSFFNFIARVATTAAQWRAIYETSIGNYDIAYSPDWLFQTGAGNKDLIWTGSGSDNFFYPSTVGSADNNATVTSKYGTLYSTLNNGDFTPANKHSSFEIELQLLSYGIKSVVSEGTKYSTQIFNFGLGDLQITDRRVGSTEYDIGNPLTVNVGVTPIYKTVPLSNPNAWTLSEIFINLVDINIRSFFCYPDTHRIETKKLYNESSPQIQIEVSDNLNYNFIYLEGQPGMNFFSTTFSGRLYETNTTTGIESNSTKIEIQFRKSTETEWRIPSSLNQSGGILTLVNNNTKNVNYNFVMLTYVSPTESLIFRIRKMELDSVNNNNGLVCDMYIDNISFNSTYPISLGNYDRLLNAPINLDGVAITAYQSDSGQTNKYSALVNSKCWVYDFDTETWTWDFNRNPAFWFLYFAYGGFKNLESEADFSYPYSPTWAWVNYPNHPDSTDHLFGVGLTNEEIDLDKIIEWAEFCETNDLKMDMVLRDDTSCADVLERIANVGRGSVTYYNGKLSVVYEDPTQVPTCLFGMGNILAGSFSVEYSVSNPVRKVIVNYTNREFDWETKQVEAIVPYSSEDNLNILEITLEGVTEESQAQREANILAARQFYQRRTYSWKSDIEGLIARRGDLVYLSHDSTQYGYSGRIKNFIYDSGNIIGIETGSYLEDSGINHVTIRYPDGNMQVYECHINGNNIYFDESYPLSKGAVYVSPTQDNNSSDYINSIPEDFIFIAGAKETPGKIVRIAEIKPDEEMNFTFTAVDEDPAMWSYEYAYSEPLPESFDDSEIVLKVTDIKTEKLGNGLVRIYWQGSEFIQIVNVFTGFPIESNGGYTFTGGVVTLELIPNEKYTLNIEPFSIGTPYKSESKKVVVWA